MWLHSSVEHRTGIAEVMGSPIQMKCKISDGLRAIFMLAIFMFATMGHIRYIKIQHLKPSSHEPNGMLMRENKGLFSFAFDSAYVK